MPETQPLMRYDLKAKKWTTFEPPWPLAASGPGSSDWVKAPSGAGVHVGDGTVNDVPRCHDEGTRVRSARRVVGSGAGSSLHALNDSAAQAPGRPGALTFR